MISVDSISIELVSVEAVSGAGFEPVDRKWYAMQFLGDHPGARYTYQFA